MKLTTAALILLGSATAFVPRTPFVASRRVQRVPLFMSEATAPAKSEETFE